MELTNESVETLIKQAVAMPNSEGKLALLEQAIAMADNLADIKLGVDARFKLMHAATYFGHSEKTLVAFAWCLARYDESPKNFGWWHERSLYWNYKWVLGHIGDFPNIPLEKALDLHEDFAKRYRAAGYSERTVHYYYMRFARHRGLAEEAKEHYEAWQKLKRDSLSDCHACETNQAIIYHIFAKEDYEALEVAKPILEGKLCCADIPRATYAEMLLPLIRLGRFDEAKHYHMQGIPLYQSTQEGLEDFAKHFVYLLFVNKLDEAVPLFEKHLPWALKTAQMGSRFDFYLAAYLLFKELVKQGKEHISLRLPTDFKLFELKGHYKNDLLASYFEQELRSLAEIFDKRNQTNRFQKRIKENEALLERLGEGYFLKNV